MTDVSEFRRAKDEWLRSADDSPLTPEQRDTFEGLTYYDENPALSFLVEPELVEPPEDVEILTSTGEVERYERWARVRFEVDGEQAALMVYRQPQSGHLFLPFRDATSGEETYEAGRYLEVHQLEGGLLVDFNYAYNPFCAYNEAYSCPLPEEENRLPVPLRAGERKFAGPVATHGH